VEGEVLVALEDVLHLERVLVLRAARRRAVRGLTRLDKV